tara:strand:- start:2595 stop:2768 length:174 start_codon:yes stop_codon:yes gene_type:complete
VRDRVEGIFPTHKEAEKFVNERKHEFKSFQIIPHGSGYMGVLWDREDGDKSLLPMYD